MNGLIHSSLYFGMLVSVGAYMLGVWLKKKRINLLGINSFYRVFHWTFDWVRYGLDNLSDCRHLEAKFRFGIRNRHGNDVCHYGCQSCRKLHSEFDGSNRGRSCRCFRTVYFDFERFNVGFDLF